MRWQSEAPSAPGHLFAALKYRHLFPLPPLPFCLPCSSFSTCPSDFEETEATFAKGTFAGANSLTEIIFRKRDIADDLFYAAVFNGSSALEEM